MQSKLIRLEDSSFGTIGSFLIDGLLFCSTLEPDSQDPEKFQVPAGKYTCKRFHGQRYKDTFEILVPGHTAILFHSGNIEAHTLACVLLARQAGYLKEHRAVLNSGHTFKQFMRMTEGLDGFYLEIIDFYKELSWGS